MLIQNPPVQGSASIRIFSVQLSDAGLYICDVTNPNDWVGSGQGLVNFTVLSGYLQTALATDRKICLWLVGRSLTWR